MVNLTEFEIYRSGSIEFTITGSRIDGRIAVRSPVVNLTIEHNDNILNPSEPAFEEIRSILASWLFENMTPQAIEDLDELEQIRWHNLPIRLNNAVLLHRVRWVLEQIDYGANSR